MMGAPCVIPTVCPVIVCCAAAKQQHMLLALCVFVATTVRQPPFGPTSTVRTALVNVSLEDGVQRRVWANAGGRVYLLDATLRELARSDELAKDVNGIGLSLSGQDAIVSTSHGLSLLTAAGKRNLAVQPVSGFASSLTAGRVADSIALVPGVESFVVAAHDTNSSVGMVLIVQLTRAGGRPSASVVASHAVGSAPFDAKMVVGNAIQSGGARTIVASTASSLIMLQLLPDGKLALQRTMPLPEGNDGFDLLTSGDSAGDLLAVVAADAKGFRIVNLRTGALLSQTAVPGWSGSVRTADSFAIVAADPGLLLFDIALPSRPTRVAACALAGGTGWNLAIDPSSRLAFVAAAGGGLHAVTFVAPALPVSYAHFGAGSSSPCNTTWPE